MVMSIADAIHLYQRLTEQQIPVWVTGGWGIDALLGEQTRHHEDLDVLVRADDVGSIRALLEGQHYKLKHLWEENRWITDSAGNRIATAFVLHDPSGRELDVHALYLDEEGNGIPAWNVEENVRLTHRELGAEGHIGGQAVRCLSASFQMRWHTGYQLPEKQVQDLKQLHQRLHEPYPPEHAHLGQ